MAAALAPINWVLIPVTEQSVNAMQLCWHLWLHCPSGGSAQLSLTPRYWSSSLIIRDTVQQGTARARWGWKYFFLFFFFLGSRNFHPDMCLVQNFLAGRLKSHWKGSLTQTVLSTFMRRNIPPLETARTDVREDSVHLAAHRPPVSWRRMVWDFWCWGQVAG